VPQSARRAPGKVAATGPSANPVLSASDNALLDELGRAHFQYFVNRTDSLSGLSADRTRPGAPASMAVIGFGLTVYPVAVSRGWIERASAADQTRKVLKTLWEAPQGCKSAGTSGSHGFFYRFVDCQTCLRLWNSEVSTVDTALLMAGVLFARGYYDAPEEADLRDLATRLFERVDWAWALHGGDRLSLGWKPKSGFLPFDWGGYNEAMILLLLAMGSSTHPIPAESWVAFTRDERAGDFFGQHYVPFAPMFGHQYSHIWVDFRGIFDAPMRKNGFDYVENSRRAGLAQHAYAIKNPGGWKGYDALNWGLSACDGPGESTSTIDGRQRTFFGYMARGAPDGPDDGTIAPSAVAASLPFAPEIVLPTLRHWWSERPDLWGEFGFAGSFNVTKGWVNPDRIGIDQGPIALMIENYRTGMIWEVMRRDATLRRGLQRAGFNGGWLETETT
jgi:hypothetical protein